jgi:ankyrin repeat protein
MDAGNAEVAKLLIGSGADVNAADKRGGTALSLATHFGHAEVVRLLKQAGARQ